MRSNNITHHPGLDASVFSTVEEQIESLRNNRVTGPASATDNAVARFDGTTGKLVQNSAVTISDAGAVAGVSTLAASGAISGASAATSGGITKNGGTPVAGVTQTFFWSWYFPVALAQDYLLVANCPIACTIQSVTTKSISGTATLTGKINSTALGGTANSVSSSEQTQTHSSANAVAIGDDFYLTPSSVSSLVGMSVTVKITVTLD